MKEYVSPTIEVAAVSPRLSLLTGSGGINVGESTNIGVKPDDPRDPSDALTRRGGWLDG